MPVGSEVTDNASGYKARPFFATDDYADVCAWWKGYDWTCVPLDMLPKVGFVVEGGKENKKLVAGWLYRTDSKIGWLEWVISDPSADKTEKHAALDKLVSVLLESAKFLKMRAVFSSLRHEGLMKVYERHGFKKTDLGMTNMTCSLEA